MCVGEDDLTEATHRGDLVQIPEIAFHKMRTISVMQRSYAYVYVKFIKIIRLLNSFADMPQRLKFQRHAKF